MGCNDVRDEVEQKASTCSGLGFDVRAESLIRGRVAQMSVLVRLLALRSRETSLAHIQRRRCAREGSENQENCSPVRMSLGPVEKHKAQGIQNRESHLPGP